MALFFQTTAHTKVRFHHFQIEGVISSMLTINFLRMISRIHPCRFIFLKIDNTPIRDEKTVVVGKIEIKYLRGLLPRPANYRPTPLPPHRPRSRIASGSVFVWYSTVLPDIYFQSLRIPQADTSPVVIIRSVHLSFSFLLLITFNWIGNRTNINFGAGSNEVVLR